MGRTTRASFEPSGAFVISTRGVSTSLVLGAPFGAGTNSIFVPAGICFVASVRVRSCIAMTKGFDQCAEWSAMSDSFPSLIRSTICFALASFTSACLACPHQIRTSAWLIASSDKPCSGSVMATEVTFISGSVRK